MSSATMAATPAAITRPTNANAAHVTMDAVSSPSCCCGARRGADRRTGRLLAAVRAVLRRVAVAMMSSALPIAAARRRTQERRHQRAETESDEGAGPGPRHDGFFHGVDRIGGFFGDLRIQLGNL